MALVFTPPTSILISAGGPGLPLGRVVLLPTLPLTPWMLPLITSLQGCL